ncbi:MAG: hypothetical protein KDA44_05245 [Planctomycetales bacterium]|nr:hypothetical protein [Planctomycetales bacterium]
MRLRTKKRLMQGIALAVLGVAAAVVTLAWRTEVPPADIEATPLATRHSRVAGAETTALNPASPAWRQTLRRPLYDPPPPPPKKVVVQVRPITVKIVGTVVEGANSQAFVKQANGRVEIKRLGDQVTGDERDGVLKSITAAEVIIERDDGEHRLPVGERN